MRLLRKSALAVMVIAFAICTAASARADTTYTYTGNALTNCTGAYLCESGSQFLAPPAVSVTFSVAAGTQLDNLTNYGFDGTNLDSFSMTDGLGNFANLGDLSALTLAISTNAAGEITFWSIVAYSADPPPGKVGRFVGLQTANEPPMYNVGSVEFDYSSVELVGNDMATPVAYGYSEDNPGSWTMTTNTTMPTPEPSSLLSLGIGLLGLAGLCLKRHC